MSSPPRYKVGIVCSSGGHLAQLHCLDAWWSRHDRFWVTFDKPDAVSLLAGERVVWGHHPTNRSLKNLARNTVLALKTLARERPDVLVSNGAGIAVPFFYVGKLLFGCKTVFVEVYDRIDSPTVTARLVRPVLDRMVVQWEEQKAFYPEGVNLGGVL
ncbi:MAG: UDP-N-acetylglucosamine--LPS N-acetylglucosamine transferase [Deltaproteobacteria bacterium]|nr:UDP-N-acetylglucosamine--LPS N-acetylglucosamine transferase [Deltaproteobacteria bacterium]